MTGCGWKLQEASQGGVCGLGTAEAEEIAGVLGSVETGAWEEHGKSREAHGKTRELGGSWRVQGGTRRKHGNLERRKQTTEINRRIKVLRSVKFFSIISEYYGSEAKNVCARSAGLVWVL